MNRDQALAKIKKCLALSRSANEHEAAAALRQAQALMREHGLSEQEAQLADVAERHSKPRPQAAVNRWEAMLAQCVDDAFGCTHFHAQKARIGSGMRVERWREVVFVGMHSAPEVAAFAFDVLARQCVAARLAHVRKQPKSCKPITRTARGDAFAVGWVLAVRKLVQRFAGQPGDMALIEQHMAINNPGLATANVRNTTVGRNVRDADLEAGIVAGKTARLDRGLTGAAAPLQLG